MNTAGGQRRYRYQTLVSCFRALGRMALLQRLILRSRLVDMGTSEAFARARIPQALLSPFRGDLKSGAFSPLSLEDAGVLFQALALSRDQPVLVYDSGEATLSSRMAWILKYYGHPSVEVLDGGLAAYMEGGGALQSAFSASQQRGGGEGLPPLEPLPQPSMLAASADVLAAINTTGGAQVLDARSPAEFSGDSSHGLPRCGHIPGAINIPFTECLSLPTRRFKAPSELRELFSSRGVDLSRPSITLCLAGVRATVLQRALGLAGAPSASQRLYDGSMAEWASNPNLPMRAK